MKHIILILEDSNIAGASTYARSHKMLQFAKCLGNVRKSQETRNTPTTQLTFLPQIENTRDNSKVMKILLQILQFHDDDDETIIFLQFVLTHCMGLLNAIEMFYKCSKYQIFEVRLQCPVRLYLYMYIRFPIHIFVIVFLFIIEVFL